MDVKNVGNKTIEITASYDDIARLVYAVDMQASVKNDKELRRLAYELHNPKVVK